MTCITGEEVTTTGICTEMIDRMAKVGACVFPPPEERGQSWDLLSQMGAAGAPSTFRAQTKPAPIVMAASFDPDGWKRVSNEMIAEAGVDVRLHSWFSRAVMDGNRIKGVVCETKAGRQAIMGDVVIDATGDLDVAAPPPAPVLSMAPSC